MDLSNSLSAMSLDYILNKRSDSDDQGFQPKSPYKESDIRYYMPTARQAAERITLPQPHANTPHTTEERDFVRYMFADLAGIVKVTCRDVLQLYVAWFGHDRGRLEPLYYRLQHYGLILPNDDIDTAGVDPYEPSTRMLHTISVRKAFRTRYLPYHGMTLPYTLGEIHPERVLNTPYLWARSPTARKRAQNARVKGTRAQGIHLLRVWGALKARQLRDDAALGRRNPPRSYTPEVLNAQADVQASWLGLGPAKTQDGKVKKNRMVQEGRSGRLPLRMLR